MYLKGIDVYRKVPKFPTLENFAVIYLKFKRRDQILGFFIKKMQMVFQIVDCSSTNSLMGAALFAQTYLSENFIITVPTICYYGLISTN